MSDTNDPLSNALGIENAVEVIPPAKNEVVVHEEKHEGVLSADAEEDYHLSRRTFRSLIQTGNEAISGINELALLSQSPRAYEVLANLLKTVSETTKDLYDLQKKTKELKDLNGPGKKVLDNGNVNIDKAVFVGTTTELLRSLKEQDKNG